MSKLKVDRITNLNEDGGPSFVQGAIVPSSALFEVNGNVNAVGIVTATGSFSGDGSALTNITVASLGKVMAFKFILADAIPFRS